MKVKTLHIVLLFCIVNLFASGQSVASAIEYKSLKVGAERTELYIPMLKNKKVGIIANQTSMIRNTHLVDSLLALEVKVIRILSPEHGFRGDADAGEHVGNYTDKKTHLPVISLYGSNKKPKVNDLDDIDILIFDIQDVGVRFYTYISTLHLVMEACSENDIQLIVLDRPNPNGFYVDGPILNMKYSSFVGMHPVPIVHGMTIGEYANMINGEGWLKDGIKCKIEVIPCDGYTHSTFYELPVKPSPNLPNMESIFLYPSLCLFEGTVMSVGRGTDFPFQVFGHPDLETNDFTFIPRSIQGAAKNPKFQGITCNGIDLRNVGADVILETKRIHIQWIRDAYQAYPDKEKFFSSFFYKLSGNEQLKQQIVNGTSIEKIYASWQEGLTHYKAMRKQYLLYEDFE